MWLSQKNFVFWPAVFFFFLHSESKRHTRNSCLWSWMKKLPETTSQPTPSDKDLRVSTHRAQGLSKIFPVFTRFSEKIQIVKNSQYGKFVRIKKKVSSKCIQKKLMLSFLDSLISERKWIRMKSTDKAIIKEYGNLSSILFYFNGMISDCQILPPVQEIIKGTFSHFLLSLSSLSPTLKWRFYSFEKIFKRSQSVKLNCLFSPGGLLHLFWAIHRRWLSIMSQDSDPCIDRSYTVHKFWNFTTIRQTL